MRTFSISEWKWHVNTMYERLTAAGYKVTEPRKRVLAALVEVGTPCTAQEVAEQAGTSVASTYRVLGLLVELGVAGEVQDEPVGEHGGAGGGNGGGGGGRRYCLCTAEGHHHHFVCRTCHATVDVASDALERAMAEIEAQTGLHVETHDVTLRGQCSRCQPARDAEPSATAGEAQV